MNRIIVYDYETYWSKDYTLSKMSAIDYVRDPRFYAQLLAISVDGKPAVVFEHGDIPAVLARMRLNEPDTILIGHNSSGFDNLITSEVYGIKPTCVMLDTIHMARWAGLSRVCGESLHDMCAYLGIGEKTQGTAISMGKREKTEFLSSDWEAFRKYCMADVDLTVQLTQKLLPFMTRTAIRFSSITCRMATDPAFVVDVDALTVYLEELNRQEAEARSTLAKILGVDDVDFLKSIRSAARFEGMLRLLNVDVPMKLSAKKTATKKKNLEEACRNLTGVRRDQAEAMLADPSSYEVFTPALSKQDFEFLALQDHPDPYVRELVRLRLDHNSSMPMSRTKALIHMGQYNKPVPVMLKCFYAHTSRYGAGTAEGKSDSLNWQNFSKHKANMKPIRKGILVPDGHVVVACDSSQIEARCVAYEAQQTDLLEQFAEHRDPYAELAAKFSPELTAQEIHDGAKAGDPELKKLRNAAKRGVLSGGYSASAGKYADSLWRDGVHLAEDKAEHDKLAKPYHTIYRNSNLCICAFWKTCKAVLDAMLLGQSGTFGGPDNKLFAFGLMPMPDGTKIPSVSLPSGFMLRYPNLRYEEESVVYDRRLGKNIVPTRIYGGALTENCVAEGTMVLTDSGWKPIQDVSCDDLVHDGIEFVRHAGLVSKGAQRCICLDGVWLTEDHEVLVDGRRNLVRPFRENAPQLQRHYRAALRQFGSSEMFSFGEREVGLGTALRLRSNGISKDGGADKSCTRWIQLLLRYLSEEAGKRQTFNTWDVKYPFVQRVALDAFAVRDSYLPCVSSVWWAGNNSMRVLAYVCEFLQRYVSYISEGFSAGQDRQQWELLSRELPLGYLQGECKEQRKRVRGSGFIAFISAIWNKFKHAAIPSATWLVAGTLAGCTKQGGKEHSTETYIQKEVFDIKDCGPRHRFVVLGKTAPFICHNCTQALAFQILMYQAELMYQEGVLLHCNIHDSFATVVPEEKAKETEEIMLRCMRTVPPWVEGLPLDAEAEVGHDFTIV